MGSGVLLAALVVLWFVVLVPMVVTRGDAQTGQVGLADSGRTLKRRRTVDPVVHADTERVAIDRNVLRTSGELQVDVHALRRRTLAGLVALATLALAGAVVYSPWRRRVCRSFRTRASGWHRCTRSRWAASLSPARRPPPVGSTAPWSVSTTT